MDTGHYKDTGFGEDITTCFMASHFASYLVNSHLITAAIQEAAMEEIQGVAMKEAAMAVAPPVPHQLLKAGAKLSNKNKKKKKITRNKSRKKSREKSRKKSREKSRKKSREKSRKKSREEKGVVRTVQRGGVADAASAAVWVAELTRISQHLGAQEPDAVAHTPVFNLIARIIEILNSDASARLQAVFLANTDVEELRNFPTHHDNILYDRIIHLNTLGHNLGVHDFSDEPLINVLIWYMWSLPGGLYKLLRSDVMNLPDGQVSLARTEEVLTRVVNSDKWSPPEDVEDADKGLWRADHAVRQEDDWIYKRGYMEFDAEWMRPPEGGNEMACSDNDVYVIDQSCFTATSSSKSVVKTNPEFFGPPNCFRRTLFCIKGIIKVEGGQYSFEEAGADIGIPTNKEIYHMASYYPGEEEYLLEPGFFVVKCALGTPKFTEEVGPGGTCHIFNVYYLPKSKKKDFFIALAIKNIVGDRRDHEAGIKRAHLLEILDRRGGDVEIVYREFRDLENLIRRAYTAFVDETQGIPATLTSRARRMEQGRSLNRNLQQIAHTRVLNEKHAVVERDRLERERERETRRAIEMRRARERGGGGGGGGGAGAAAGGAGGGVDLLAAERARRRRLRGILQGEVNGRIAGLSDDELKRHLRDLETETQSDIIQYEIMMIKSLLRDREDAKWWQDHAR